MSCSCLARLFSSQQVEDGLALLKQHGCDHIVSFGEPLLPSRIALPPPARPLCSVTPDGCASG